MADEFTLQAAEVWVRGFATAVESAKQELTELDSAIGDADHGANMARGMAAVVAALDGSQADLGALLKKVGLTLVSSVGGASGPLYGTFFLRAGTAAGDATALDAGSLANVLRAGVDGVVSRGKATTGEKTMLDALVPAMDALDSALAAEKPLAEALADAAAAAARGRDATVEMTATKGRASYLGERSVGHADPGATSSAMLLAAVADAAVA